MSFRDAINMLDGVKMRELLKFPPVYMRMQTRAVKKIHFVGLFKENHFQRKCTTKCTNNKMHKRRGKSQSLNRLYRVPLIHEFKQVHTDVVQKVLTLLMLSLSFCTWLFVVSP